MWVKLSEPHAFLWHDLNIMSSRAMKCANIYCLWYSCNRNLEAFKSGVERRLKKKRDFFLNLERVLLKSPSLKHRVWTQIFRAAWLGRALSEDKFLTKWGNHKVRMFSSSSPFKRSYLEGRYQVIDTKFQELHKYQLTLKPLARNLVFYHNTKISHGFSIF